MDFKLNRFYDESTFLFSTRKHLEVYPKFGTALGS